MESKQKRTWGDVYNAHPNICSKSNKQPKKILTCHDIIDRISEKIVLVITRVRKESMSSSELTTVKCLIYLFI